MYLLDTNVVSELRKAKSARGDPRVIAWAGTVPPAALFVSVITVLELELGILRIEPRDPAQGQVLRNWFERQVLPAFAERILTIDTAVARRCAGLHVPDARSDRDALIAATAQVHAMAVVTRNVTDFAPTGVTVIDPWKVPMPSAPNERTSGRRPATRPRRA